MVPVPRRHLSAVYQMLATEMGKASNQDVSVPLSNPANPASDTAWTRDEILRLKRMIRTDTPRVILDLTTSQVNERISLRDIEKVAVRTYPQARADLAGFTQLLNREFDGKESPFKVEWKPGGFASYYCDSTDIAAWWQND